MAWSDLRKSLQELSKEQVVDLLKGLHDLSPQNKAWLRGKLLPIGQDAAYLEECRRKVIKAVYDPARKMPGMPHFRDAKGIIADYRKSTRDLRGTLDLMLTTAPHKTIPSCAEKEPLMNTDKRAFGVYQPAFPGKYQWVHCKNH
jgi:hypothetical protein